MPRQRVQHSANLISTRPFSTHWLCTVTKKGCLQIAFSVLILLYGVGTNFPCKSEQIHWNGTVGKRYKCLDCPDCPSGSQPSVACGSSVKYGTPVDCIPCKLGKTYSDKYDKSQCKACTICSKGKAVKNNCTLSANTKCDNKCGQGFYPVHFIFSCLPCTQCCDDGKDELATECTNYEKKCKVRSTPCTHVQTTPPITTRPGHNTSSTLPTTQTVPFKRDAMRTYEDEKRVSDGFSVPITPTWSLDNEALKDEEEESGNLGGISIVVFMLVIALALCLVLFILAIVKKLIRVRSMLRSSSEENQNNGNNNIAQGITSPQPSRSTSPQSSGSTSPILSRSGGESPHDLLNGSPQPDGSASPQPDGSSQPQPNGYTSSQPDGSSQPQSNGYASSQPDRSSQPQPNGYASSQPGGSSQPQSNGYASSQPDGSSQPQPNGYASSQPNSSKSPHPNGSASAQSNRSTQVEDKSNPGDVTLEELEKNNLAVFDWMCKELDNSRRGARWDFESLASKYNEISLTIRNSLSNEFQSVRGSPSDVLMTHIKTKYPDHPLRHLVRNLQSIGRNDIAQKLMPYMVRKVDHFVPTRALT